MRIKTKSSHIKSLCKALGENYTVRMIDLEYCIYRDFGNGYDVEVGGVNTSSLKRKATIYLWKDKYRTVLTVKDVPQEQIGGVVDAMLKLTKGAAPWDDLLYDNRSVQYEDFMKA